MPLYCTLSVCIYLPCTLAPGASVTGDGRHVSANTYFPRRDAGAAGILKRDISLEKKDATGDNYCVRFSTFCCWRHSMRFCE
jgi:hypothetical protein